MNLACFQGWCMEEYLVSHSPVMASYSPASMELAMLCIFSKLLLLLAWAPKLSHCSVFQVTPRQSKPQRNQLDLAVWRKKVGKDYQLPRLATTPKAGLFSHASAIQRLIYAVWAIVYHKQHTEICRVHKAQVNGVGLMKPVLYPRVSMSLIWEKISYTVRAQKLCKLSKTCLIC